MHSIGVQRFASDMYTFLQDFLDTKFSLFLSIRGVLVAPVLWEARELSCWVGGFLSRGGADSRFLSGTCKSRSAALSSPPGWGHPETLRC